LSKFVVSRYSAKLDPMQVPAALLNGDLQRVICNTGTTRQLP